MHVWKTFEKRKKEMKTRAVLLLFAWNFFFLLWYPSEKGAISASQTDISSVNNYFIDFFKNKF